MKRPHFFWKWLTASISLAIGTLGLAPLARGADGPAQPRNYRFDGTMSREVLENYLSRAITMEGLLNGKGDLDDNIRMLKATGAKFIGRSLCLWGGEAQLLSNLQRAKQQAPRLHEADPDMILQGCIFEIVTTQVDRVPVPDWAFVALGQPVENRNFCYADMLYPEWPVQESLAGWPLGPRCQPAGNEAVVLFPGGILYRRGLGSDPFRADGIDEPQ